MATSQTIAQPRFSEYPLSGTAAAKRLWTSDGWDVYLPKGKKQRLLTMFWTHPHLETSSSNSGPFRPSRLNLCQANSSNCHRPGRGGHCRGEPRRNTSAKPRHNVSAGVIFMASQPQGMLRLLFGWVPVSGSCSDVSVWLDTLGEVQSQAFHRTLMSS